MNWIDLKKKICDGPLYIQANKKACRMHVLCMNLCCTRSLSRVNWTTYIKESFIQPYIVIIDCSIHFNWKTFNTNFRFLCHEPKQIPNTSNTWKDALFINTASNLMRNCIKVFLLEVFTKAPFLWKSLCSIHVTAVDFESNVYCISFQRFDKGCKFDLSHFIE